MCVASVDAELELEGEYGWGLNWEDSHWQVRARWWWVGCPSPATCLSCHPHPLCPGQSYFYHLPQHHHRMVFSSSFQGITWVYYSLTFIKPFPNSNSLMLPKLSSMCALVYLRWISMCFSFVFSCFPLKMVFSQQEKNLLEAKIRLLLLTPLHHLPSLYLLWTFDKCY